MTFRHVRWIYWLLKNEFLIDEIATNSQEQGLDIMIQNILLIIALHPTLILAEVQIYYI